MKPIDIQLVRQSIAYDPETGIFRWIVSKRGHRKSGDVAGCNARGYQKIKIAQTTYLAHRLAWVFFYGKEPEGEIDHINGNPSDNRIANLREATRQQNCQNIDGAGVNFESGRGKWLARICVKGKQKNLGRFDTKEQARSAYIKASQSLRGAFSRAP